MTQVCNARNAGGRPLGVPKSLPSRSGAAESPLRCNGTQAGRNLLTVDMLREVWRSAPIRWALLAVAVVSTTGWVASLRPLATHWGSVGEWVAGLATAAGLIFAGRQIRDATAERAEEDARRRASEIERREAQARSVAVWSVADRGRSRDDKWTIRYNVLNGGDYPVDNAVLLVADLRGDYDPITQRGTAHELVLGTLIPGRLLEDSVEVTLSNEPSFGELGALVDVIFTDSWNEHWARGPMLLARRPSAARSC